MALFTAFPRTLLLLALIRGVSPPTDPRVAHGGENDRATVTLDQARTLVKEREAGEDVHVVGPISVAGYNWARELEIGSGTRIMAISCNLGGGLLVFDVKGALTGFRRTSEIRSAGIFSLYGGPRLVVLTNERDDTGSGFQHWFYHLYAVDERIKELWVGESYFLNDTPPKPREERVGFVWFGPYERELWHQVRNQVTGRVRITHLRYSDAGVFTPAEHPK